MASPAAPSTLHLQVGEMRQIFNAMDPSPFRERDLDPKAEEYIVDWAREVERHAVLALDVTLSREPAGREATTLLGDAVHGYFRERATATRRELRQLMHRGRISLVIGLAFLAAAFVAGDLLAGLASKDRYGSILQETFVIGGWVALWRPLEIFLYDWWPFVSDARLFDRLAAMRVEVRGAASPG